MSNGDMIVLGLVSPSHLIEDLKVAVPQGCVVTIPGYQTLVSKDLHRGISMKCLAVVPNTAVPTILRVDASEKSRADKLAAENARLAEQLSVIEARNEVLETSCASLRSQVAELQSRDSKFDAILTAINDRPVVTQVVQQVESGPRNGLVALPSDNVVGGEVPMFIPTQIKSDSMDGDRVSVKEDTSTDSGVSAAASKLKALRKKQ